MARPRSFDREQALAVAVEQFWRQGYEETSVATLTRAMGISPPSLYAAFGDKHRLFDEVASTYVGRVCGALDQAAELPTARAYVERVLEDTALAHTASDTPPGCLLLTEPRLAAQREAVRVQIRERLERGVRDGDLPADTDADALATYLVAVLRGMSGAARDGATLDDVQAIVSAALRAIPA